jgi:hypothetical protein
VELRRRGRRHWEGRALHAEWGGARRQAWPPVPGSLVDRREEAAFGRGDVGLWVIPNYRLRLTVY